MFTKNFFVHLGYPMFGMSLASLTPYFVSYSGGKPSGTPNSNLTNIQTLMSKTPNVSSLTGTNNNSASGVYFGNGTAEPTANDYKLSGSWMQNLTSTPNVTFEYDDAGVTCTGIYTITNGGSSDFTVSEVGMVEQLGFNGAGTSYYKLLMERTLLDTPVTIPAGGIGQVTYKIRYNYPT